MNTGTRCGLRTMLMCRALNIPQSNFSMTSANAVIKVPADCIAIFKSEGLRKYFWKVEGASSDFKRVLCCRGIAQSMSGNGACCDNAMVESFFKTVLTISLLGSRLFASEDRVQSSNQTQEGLPTFAYYQGLGPNEIPGRTDGASTTAKANYDKNGEQNLRF